MRINKEYLFFLILSVLIIFVVFYELLFGHKVLVSGDNLSPLAIKAAISDSILQTHVYPLWSPWVLGGMPTIHSLLNISDSYYPHKTLSYIINILGLPWIWYFLFHMIFGSIGMYKFLKYLTINKYTSFIISISFMIMPYMIAMLVHGHGSQVMTACFIPWIMMYLFKIINGKYKLKDLALLSLLVGLQLQRGHIQIAYYTWMMIGLYILINFINYIFIEKNNTIILLKEYLLLFSSLFIGVVFSLNLYYPILKFSQYSIRGLDNGGAGIEYATQWSFSLKESLTLIFPSAMGFGGPIYQNIGSMPFTDYPNYIGIILFAFAVVGLIKVKMKNINKIFFISVIIFSLFLALGKNFIGFYSLFYNYLPYFNNFRAPVFILILLNFSLFVFSGLGIDKVLDDLKNKKSLSFFFYVLIGLFLLQILFYFMFQSFIPSNYNYTIEYLGLINNDLTIYSLLIILLGICVLFIKLKKINYNFFYFIVLILCVYDFSRIAQEIITPNLHIPNKTVVQDNEYLTHYLKEDETVKIILSDKTKFRIYDPIAQNRWSVFRVENILGYHPAKLSNYDLLKKSIDYKKYKIWPIGILKLLNVKYLLLPHNPNNNYQNDLFNLKATNSSMYYFGNNPIYDGKLISVDVIQFKESFARLFFPKNIVKVSDKNKIFDLITTDSFDPIETSYFHSIQLGDSKSFANDNPIVKIDQWSPNEIHFSTNTLSEHFLVMSEIYFPYGWNLSDGYNNYSIHEVNNLVRGFYVPVGTTSFVMKFNPNDVIWGHRFSILSLMLILLTFIYICRKKI